MGRRPQTGQDGPLESSGVTRLEEVVAEDGARALGLDEGGEQREDEGALVARRAPSRAVAAERLIAREDQGEVAGSEPAEVLDHLGSGEINGE